LASVGEIDRPFFLRSAAKPFQAAVSQRCGADLSPIEMAMACASHDGHPVQVALVERMLSSSGLSEDQLGCPRTWPLAVKAGRRMARAGHLHPRRIWNNCSGKHAAMLRACVASGWDPHSYLDPSHPLQVAIIEMMNQLGGSMNQTGTDGCGVPVLSTTARKMAAAYARLASAPDLADVFAAMHTYPALVSGPGNHDTAIAVWVDAVAKRGAAGCLGVGVRNRLGLAVKAWDGFDQAAGVAALAALDELGLVSPAARSHLDSLAHPPILGGGRRVGSMEPRLELQWQA
jgi:L-asparaginase II